jgi:DNA repair ATPase RecN
MKRFCAALLLLLLLVSSSLAGKRRDPLTDAEADQIREMALEPGKRMRLYIKFTEARLESIDQLRADPKEAAGRGKRIHDLLEDFTALLDEINENLDQYQGRPLNKDDRKDYRKSLKEVVLAVDRFDAHLRSLKNASETDPQTRREADDFRFVMQDATEALASCRDIAREYLKTESAKEPEPEKKK